MMGHCEAKWSTFGECEYEYACSGQPSMAVPKSMYFAMARCGRKAVLATGTIERRRKESEVEYGWEEREDNL